MEPWVSKNNPALQTAAAVGIAVAGLLLAYLARRAGLDGANAKAGFLLGLLLLAVGIGAFLARASQTVTVDPRGRRIVVEDRSLLGTRRRTIPFGEILDVRIGFLGKRSGFVGWYYLSLRLKAGGEYPLFAPGRFYPGATDRAVVEAWRGRLAGYLERTVP